MALADEIRKWVMERDGRKKNHLLSEMPPKIPLCKLHISFSLPSPFLHGGKCPCPGGIARRRKYSSHNMKSTSSDCRREYREVIMQRL